MKFTPDNYKTWGVEPARLTPQKKIRIPQLNWGLVITMIVLILFIGLIISFQLGGI